jgi:hypothetical protein
MPVADVDVVRAIRKKDKLRACIYKERICLEFVNEEQRLLPSTWTGRQ